MNPLPRHTVTSADGTTISYTSTGDGPGLILLGGSLRTSEDYLPLAAALAGSFTVHVVDRRERPGSGPLGAGYTVDKEVEDLLAVQARTTARLVFGHSYGGLVALRTACSYPLFDRIAVYEPGVPAAEVPTEWMAPYRQRLAAGDERGAFAHFVKGSGGAPAIMARMPHWYLRLALRIGLRGRTWERMRPLLPALVAEHEQIAAQLGRLGEFAAVKARVLVLCGSRSAPSARAEYAALRDTLPHADLETLDGLGHFGPEGKSASVVAGRVLTSLLEAKGS